jgi:hypothetical protein
MLALRTNGHGWQSCTPSALTATRALTGCRQRLETHACCCWVATCKQGQHQAGDLWIRTSSRQAVRQGAVTPQQSKPNNALPNMCAAAGLLVPLMLMLMLPHKR